MIKPSGVVKLALALLGVFALSVATSHAATANRGIELVTEPGGGAYENRFFSADPDGNGVYYEVSFENDGPAGVRADGMVGDQFAAMRGATSWENDWLSDYCPGHPSAKAPGAACAGAELGSYFVSAGQGRVVINTPDGSIPTSPMARA